MAGFVDVSGWLGSSVGGWAMGGFVGRSVCSWWWVWVLPGGFGGCGLG